MADASGGHSSGEYSGVVEEANVAYSGDTKGIGQVISSGKSVQEDRKARREKKEKEKKEKEGSSGQTDSGKK
jgi:hypothetical protein